MICDILDSASKTFCWSARFYIHCFCPQTMPAVYIQSVLGLPIPPAPFLSRLFWLLFVFLNLKHLFSFKNIIVNQWIKDVALVGDHFNNRGVLIRTKFMCFFIRETFLWNRPEFLCGTLDSRDVSNLNFFRRYFVSIVWSFMFWFNCNFKQSILYDVFMSEIAFLDSFRIFVVCD